jgi:hypothetical protein
MSKVDDLRKKYPKVHNSTFERFVEGDTTPTKKYLEYMLLLWTCKRGSTSFTTSQLIKEVKRFDSLLPYHKNKDIYSSDYMYFSYLVRINNSSEEIKDEKTFNRDEHANVIFEDDNYLLLEPKTHKGSLKYGANTKWCTASKGNPQTFTNYVKRGCLVYLIDKKNSKGDVSKVAFYNEKGGPLSGQILMYNQKDTCVTEHNLLSEGWSIQLIVDFIMRYRLHYFNLLRIKKSRDEVNKIVSVIKTLDLSSLSKNMEILKGAGSTEFEGVKDTIDNFVKRIENGVDNLNF